MAIKKGSSPKTFPAKLTITGSGEKASMNITFHNRKVSEIDAMVKEVEGSKEPFLPSLVLFLVSEWDTDFSLSLEGIKELEDERPGVCEAILELFHAERRAKREKN